MSTTATLGSPTRRPIRPASDFVDSGFFALRTPLLPFDEFVRWGEGLESPAMEGVALEAAIARDRVRLRQRLTDWLADPAVREALLVASPDLHASLDNWKSGPDSERGMRVERTLVRYFTRMSARPTPFGLFAGNSLGRIADSTHLRLGPRDSSRRHARLDMEYLCALGDALARLPAVRANLLLRPNSSLYRAAGRLRYVEARTDGRSRSHHLVAIDPTDYLDATLERARAGATRGELARALTGADVALEDAEHFVDQLIDAKILVHDLEPQVTGEEPLRAQAGILRAQAGAENEALRLENVQRMLDELRDAPANETFPRYAGVVDTVRSLPVPVDAPYLFQVELVKSSPEACLGRDVVEEIAGAIELLRKLSPPPPSRSLDRFRDAFLDRYEQREVPLLEALDEEAGIGFDPAPETQAEASPLIDGLGFPAARSDGADREARLVQLALRGLVARSGREPLELGDDDVEALARPHPDPLPDSLAALASVLAESQEALDAGEFRVMVEMADGPSGARLLGRFCHGDPALERAVAAHLRAEERLEPDAIFAEIVHLSEGRLGNILCRPVLRRHEIAFLARSGAPPEAQIPLDDLAVSVSRGRVVLRSRSRAREVVPRLSSAHNFSWRSLGVYRFLCSLQEQGRATRLMWAWGALEVAPFLPRVTRGRVILARARWRVRADEIRTILEQGDGARLEAMRAWRERRALPRLAVLADLDNRLVVDFENVLSLDSFLALISKRDDFVLEEMLSVAESRVAEGPEGRFVHELLVPFERRAGEDSTRGRSKVMASPATPMPANCAAPPQRRFAPGSEWQYWKLYCGPGTADDVLRRVVHPLMDEWRARLRGWFFVRFGDPQWHLRLRVHGDPGLLRRQLAPALELLAAPLLEDGRIQRIALDTYEPEIERYGGPLGIALSERLFEADSDCALAIVATLEGDAGLDARWRLALRGADLLLEDLGLKPEERVTILEKQRDALGLEMRVDRDFERRLDRRYRERRADLEALFRPGSETDGELAPGLKLLGARSEKWRSTCDALRAEAGADRIAADLETLAASHIHMHCNRLLRSAHRAQELVIYDFLIRLLQSRMARADSRRAPE